MPQDLARSNLITHRLSEKLNSPIVVSVPHSGLTVPEERKDLMMLPSSLFYRDVDFEIHRIWQQNCLDLDISFIKAESHRYALDLNRSHDQVDASMQEHHTRPAGSEKRGLFWTRSTWLEPLSADGKDFRPLSAETVAQLIDLLWRPYYALIEQELARVQAKFGFAILVDGHSMPSQGKGLHDDPGGVRAQIVPGDLGGKSCDPRISQAAATASQRANLSFAFNQPYAGGNITKHFGQTARGRHALQIEVNRSVYMNESSRELNEAGLARLKNFTRDLLEQLRVIEPRPPA